jgi:Tfp pilus assembly protein PilF
LLFCFVLFLTDPSQATLLLQQGLIALQHGQLTQAQDAFEEASKADPNNAYVWASLAETYLREKKPQQASAAAQTAEKVGSGDPVVSENRNLLRAHVGVCKFASPFRLRF